MAAAYIVFRVTIPEGNGYRHHPQAVLDRVIPHLQKIEPYAELEQDFTEWKLTTPHLSATVVAQLLQNHYGFETRAVDEIVK